MIKKMEDDFGKAAKALDSIMKKWSMVHNLVSGLPVEAIQKLETLRAANVKREFGFMGLEGFEAKIFSLEESKIEDLLGIAACSNDAQDIQTAELRELVAALAEAADEVEFDVTAIKPVPPEKLVFNKLPNHWRALIAGGWPNAGIVARYFNQHHDPLLGDKVAQNFRIRYKYLKDQHLDPGAIMAALYVDLAGIGVVTASRQVAAQGLLAYLFESCDIFEDQPEKTKL